MNIFEKRESNVRGYCRVFDKVFVKSQGARIQSEDGDTYIDFFAGAGGLNYGHNPPAMREKLIEYLTNGGVVHSLDMYTTAKRDFMKRFEEVILEPRDMDYKLMFTGPTGTNAVEAALKLARKVTGRTQIVSFTNGYHGMTLGSLAVTGNSAKRKGAGVPLDNTTTLPFDGFHGCEDTISLIEGYLEDTSSGLDKPAAFIIETVQGEGGVNVARASWLRKLASIAKKHDILLIVDDIQAGCGRTGSFFSFEDMGFVPDMVTLSKSLSGMGLPFAITLIRPELDIWAPGEHNGTFRGHNLAFVTATVALDYWTNDKLSKEVEAKGKIVSKRLQSIVDQYKDLNLSVRGKGLIWGLDFGDSDLAGEVAKRAFANGLLIETSGSRDQVLKVLPPLTIEKETLQLGMDVIAESLYELTHDNHLVEQMASV